MWIRVKNVVKMRHFSLPNNCRRSWHLEWGATLLNFRTLLLCLSLPTPTKTPNKVLYPQMNPNTQIKRWHFKFRSSVSGRDTRLQALETTKSSQRWRPLAKPNSKAKALCHKFRPLPTTTDLFQGTCKDPRPTFLHSSPHSSQQCPLTTSLVTFKLNFRSTKCKALTLASTWGNSKLCQFNQN